MDIEKKVVGNKRRLEKIICETCGITLCRGAKLRHDKSKRHRTRTRPIIVYDKIKPIQLHDKITLKDLFS